VKTSLVIPALNEANMIGLLLNGAG